MELGYILPQSKESSTIGIFAGSNWDVPTFDYYEMIDKIIVRFEKSIPMLKFNIKVEFLRKIILYGYQISY